MDFAQPKVSIITPFYKAEKYLADAIKSVLTQRYQNWELLLVNDGSPDKAKEIALSFSDTRIRYFEQMNQGVSAARNKGLEHMTGDFFCFLDADDVLPVDSLEARVKVFVENPKVDFVDGEVSITDEKNADVIRCWKPHVNGNPFLDLMMLNGGAFVGLTWMIRRKNNVEYAFDQSLTHAEDLLFLMQLSKEGGIYIGVETVILRYRITGVSAMRNLRGLEDGYRTVYSRMKHWEITDQKSLAIFKKKSQLIMLKCYLRRGQVFRALNVFFNWVR